MYVCCRNGATLHSCKPEQMCIIQVKHGEHDSYFKNCYKSLLWSSMGMAMSPWERVIVEAWRWFQQKLPKVRGWPKWLSYVAMFNATGVPRKYSYVRTYINFTGSGVREILKGEPSLVETSKGKNYQGCDTQGLRPWVLGWGRRPLLACVLHLAATNPTDSTCPPSRPSRCGLQKVKGGCYSKYYYSKCYSKWALREI